MTKTLSFKRNLYKNIFSKLPHIRARTEKCKQYTTFPVSLCYRGTGSASPQIPQFCNVTKDEEFPQAPKLLCFAVWHTISSVSFKWFFLLSNCLVVEVGEGCRQRELSWRGARVCCCVLGGDGCLCMCSMPGIIFMYVCVRVCVPFLPWESLQQVWHVVMGNYAAQCKTFADRGHPLSALPSS